MKIPMIEPSRPYFIVLMIALLAFSAGAVSSQTVLMAQKLDEDTGRDPFGPNQRHYVHAYASVGLLFGPPDAQGGKIKVPHSLYSSLGTRYKFKIGEVYSLGLDLGLDRYSYELKQVPSKRVPDNIRHKKEEMVLNCATAAFWHRFNFGRRGNHIGSFFDLGAFGEYAFGRKHIYVDEVGVPEAKDQQVKTRGLTYVRPWQYGALMRAGYNRFVLFGKYRLSDIFKESEPGKFMPELPRFLVGLQFGFHR